MVSAKYGAPNPTEAVTQTVMAFGMSRPINILQLLPKCQTPMAASDSHLTVLYIRKKYLDYSSSASSQLTIFTDLQDVIYIYLPRYDIIKHIV